MRIAFLSRYQNVINRGAESFVEELAKRLRKKNVVDVLKGKESDSLPKILLGKYDVVIPMNGGFQSLKASIGRIFGKYKVLIVGEAGIGKVAIWNTTFVQPNIFVALTDYMARWVKGWAWNTEVVKISNGVDIKKFSKIGEKINFNLSHPIILSVGALVWYKYHERTIEAVARLKRGSLLIVGEGKDHKKLSEMGRKKLGKRFKITQFNYSDMPKVYRSSDIFTLPSWSREAFGIVYIEAMASGLGVVAPDDASRREIIGSVGIFVDTCDADKYADAIDRALSNDWSKKARIQAEKFSWDKIAKEYEEVLIRLG